MAHCRSVQTTVLSADSAGQRLRATSSSCNTQVGQRRRGDSAGSPCGPQDACGFRRRQRSGHTRGLPLLCPPGWRGCSSASQRVAPRFTLNDSQGAREGARKEWSPSAHRDGAQGTQVSRPPGGAAGAGKMKPTAGPHSMYRASNPGSRDSKIWL